MISSEQYFQAKLSYETDCADVYQAMLNGEDNFVLLDVRAPQAYQKSHAIKAINLPSSKINEQSIAALDKSTPLVVYCWGPGCNGATKAAAKLSALGYQVKEMIGGIQYWEDFERYPVNRRVNEAQQ